MKAYTDEKGYYRIELPEIKTTWNMISYYEHPFEGKVQDFNLTSVTDRTFGGPTGAVRDFVWDINSKVIIGIFEYPENEDWPKFSLDDVELTLTPVGKLIDGSEGKTIRGMCEFTMDGPALLSVPIGKYKITARWMPDGIDPMPVKISEYAVEKLEDSVVTSNFENVYGTEKRLEVKVGFPQ